MSSASGESEPRCGECGGRLVEHRCEDCDTRHDGEKKPPVPSHLLGYDAAEVRKVRGAREDGRNVHYEPCDGLVCPCFQEGTDVRAHNHYSMLLWFAQQAPDLMRQALAEAAEFGSRTLAAKHQEHYRSCGCLGDSAVCCDPTCECHDTADFGRKDQADDR